MSSAKEDILARIRSSLEGVGPAPEPVRNYRRVSELTEEQTIDMLVGRLIDYKANVFFATPENISEVIAERVRSPPTWCPRAWRRSGCPPIPPSVSTSPTPVAPSSPVA